MIADMKRILLSWSSGKDSAWALQLLRRDPAIEVCGLLTTLNSEFDRVAMHGTRRSVLEAQARAAHLPLVDCASAVAMHERCVRKPHV